MARDIVSCHPEPKYILLPEYYIRAETGATVGHRQIQRDGHSAEKIMAKLRHIAIQVPDLEKAAAFYEGVFDLKRVAKVEAPIGNAISLSDGIMNLTLLQFPEGTKGGKGGPDWAGLHHFGFVVDDEGETEQRSRITAASFSCSCRNIPASTQKRNSRTSTALCSTSPSTTGGKPKKADADRRRQRTDD